MKGKARSIILFTSLMLIAAALLPGTAFSKEEPKAAVVQAVLQNSDCVKCHSGPPADIARAGGKHKDVGCTDCHSGHRPASKDNIPQCSMCHEGQSHFELKGCLNCHKNPHTPLNIILAGELTEPCLTCHDSQIKELRENKSKHTSLACSFCHDVHGKIPECVGCHTPHPGMVQTDCKKCHKPHMPTMVAYGSSVENKDCAACHKRAFDLLTASKAKHSTKTCSFCHKEVHKAIAPCTKCHSQPHPDAIMAKFPKCGDCHYIAHDLNNWPQGAQAAPAKK